MRHVIYSVAASLDGYIAGPRGEFDWIPQEPDLDWDAFMARFDTVLMGRRTYETAKTSLPKMRCYVFSKTLQLAAHPQVTVVSQNAAERVSALRQEPGRDIWLMGGGVLFRSLLLPGLVDRVEVGLVPILLGRGVPLLPEMERYARLALQSIREYPSGLVLLDYSIGHPAR